MKKTVAALTLGAILIPAAVYAGHHFGEQRDAHRLARMTEHLQLNEQQQTDMQQILAEQRDKRMALREETRGRIDAVLTEEQRAKVEAFRAQRHQGMCERHAMNPRHES